MKTKTHRLNFTLTDQTVEQLEAIRKAEKRTKTNMLELLIEREYKRQSLD